MHLSRTLRRRPARLLAAIAAVAAAIVLAGCFSITGQTTVQDGDIGDVLVNTDMCLMAGQAGCSGGLTASTDGDVQYLFGYLVPTWALEPQTVDWDGNLGPHTLERNIAYENILQGFAPAPLGLHWIGYSTGEEPPPPTGTDTRMQLKARIGVPADSTVGTLQLATVTGWRIVRDSGNGTRTPLPIDRAFNCNENTDNAPSTVCILSGEPTQATTPGQTPQANDIAINTLSLGPAPAKSIRAGATAVLQFPQSSNWSGNGNDTIPTKVTSTLRGAKIEAPPAIILGASNLPAEVRVTAPLTAETGDYTVTLQTANGLRKATAQLHVTSIRSLINAQAPAVTTLKESVKQLRVYLKTAKSSEMRRGNTFDLPVALPTAGTLTGVLSGKGGSHGTLSKGTAKLKFSGTATLHLVPNAKAQRILRRGGAIGGTLRLTFKPKSGKAQQAALTVRLK